MKERDKLIEQLSEAKPLEIGKRLQEIELYERKDTLKVIDEVYEEFSSGAHMEETVLQPVFCSIIDGLLEAFPAGRKSRKKGLTASRIYQECKHFSYDGEQHYGADPDGYVEYKNARENTQEYGDKKRGKYDRSIYDDDSKRKYKKYAVDDNEGRINLKDEYTGKRNIYADQNNPDLRRNDSKHRYQAQVDHITPLEKVHEQYKSNYGLSDTDIARIANSDDNLALTAAYINQGFEGRGGKNKMTNSQYIADQEQREKEGRPHANLDKETKDNMLRLERESQDSMKRQVNKTVLDNLRGKGTVDDKEYREAYNREQTRLGRELSKDEKQKIDNRLAQQKQKQIYGTAVSNAVAQSKDYAIGNLLLYIIKPIYYEIADCFKNGIEDGVSADSVKAAFMIRFGRVKNYVLTNVREFLGDNLRDFIKNLISSIIEGIISLFVGIFKQVLKIAKEGVRIFVNSAKVLFGKDAKKMSAAEKGDAIIKIIGGGVIAICGIGLEALINKIGIGEPWSIVLSTMLSGIASALFMYLLDRIDLFSTKAEKRRDRIFEVFDERIKDIQQAVDYSRYNTLETLRKQKLEFNDIFSSIQRGIKKDNINAIDQGLDRMAAFFGITFPYRSNDEFWDYIDSIDVIEL